jgi:hypothetical protein
VSNRAPQHKAGDFGHQAGVRAGGDLTYRAGALSSAPRPTLRCLQAGSARSSRPSTRGHALGQPGTSVLLHRPEPLVLGGTSVAEGDLWCQAGAWDTRREFRASSGDLGHRAWLLGTEWGPRGSGKGLGHRAATSAPGEGASGHRARTLAPKWEPRTERWHVRASRCLTDVRVLSRTGAMRPEVVGVRWRCCHPTGRGNWRPLVSSRGCRRRAATSEPLFRQA